MYNNSFRIPQRCDNFLFRNKNIVSSDYNYDELGNVILNSNLGRKSKDDITVCDLTGTGVQDTAIARHTFNIALKKKLGIEV